MILKRFDKADYTTYICKHEVGLYWSKLAIRILTKLFQSEMLNQDVKDDMFSFDLKNDALFSK